MIYGYCRISTKKQNIERQERNIKAAYPDAVIVREVYTGTRSERPEWLKIMRQVEKGRLNESYLTAFLECQGTPRRALNCIR